MQLIVQLYQQQFNNSNNTLKYTQIITCLLGSWQAYRALTVCVSIESDGIYAAITRSLAALFDAASMAANGLKKTPEAVVSRGNGHQNSTSSSDRSKQCNKSFAGRILHQGLGNKLLFVS